MSVQLRLYIESDTCRALLAAFLILPRIFAVLSLIPLAIPCPGRAPVSYRLTGSLRSGGVAHGDVLGAVLGSGIVRGKVGDVLLSVSTREEMPCLFLS